MRLVLPPLWTALDRDASAYNCHPLALNLQHSVALHPSRSALLLHFRARTKGHAWCTVAYPTISNLIQHYEGCFSVGHFSRAVNWSSSVKQLSGAVLKRTCQSTCAQKGLMLVRFQGFWPGHSQSSCVFQGFWPGHSQPSCAHTR